MSTEQLERIELEDVSEAKALQRERSTQEAVRKMGIETANAQRLQLDELIKFDLESENNFKIQIYINLVLFAMLLLFGFFSLGVALLLDGPNYLTNLPYFGYDCDIDYVEEYCEWHTDPKTIFVDSLYYTIVSMSTVGYGGEVAVQCIHV